MLAPKRVKYRKTMKGRRRGAAQAGNTLNFGDYGVKAATAGWVTSRQIEAARVAMTRFVKRGGKIWIRMFPTSRSPRSPRKPAWARGRAHPRNGSA
jgi:large subunit ribosomal protein L16